MKYEKTSRRRRGAEAQGRLRVEALEAREMLAGDTFNFDSPEFVSGALNGQQGWAAESTWLVDTAANADAGAATTSQTNEIAVYTQPVTLASPGETFSYSVNLRFGGGPYATPSAFAYLFLSGLKSTPNAAQVLNGAGDADANIQIISGTDDYRLLNNFSVIPGAGAISGTTLDAGDVLQFDYTVTLGSDAASTRYAVRLQNLTDGTDTGAGTVNGVNTAVYNALTGSGAYVFFQSINPGAGGTNLSGLQVDSITGDFDTGDPTADAGPNRVVVLPDDSVTLDGSATDDGAIASYQWSLVSGPNSPTLTDANTEDLTASGLVQGVYEFELLVTDDEGQIDTDRVLVNVVPDTGDGLVTGELKRWHKVTVDFQGPNTTETAANNPFLNYRLDVTFTGPSGQTYVVPGFYAADGDAGNSSATSGDVWRVHFAPDEAGDWSYTASFRTGTNVAVDDDPLAGASAGFFDGASGAFAVGESDKAGRDLRGKGRLEYVGERYLKFAGTGEYFLKQGPDAPENLLAYEDFDNTTNEGGRLKSYTAHAGDWNPGDPSWQGGKGTELIGAVNYLASEGLNAFSFLPMNIQGDDKNVFPYLSKNASDRTRIDVSKLAQWEVVFEHATQQGFFLHFKTQETENDQLLDGGALGVERTLYYRELIARFSHHLALNWNLGEENTNTTQQRKDFAQYFYDNDPYRHHIVLHTFPGQKDAVYDPLLGDASELTGASLQTNAEDFSQVHADTVKWVNDSAAAGKPWAIAVDEPGDPQHALRPDNDAGASHENGRKNALWGTLMGGGYGNEWYFGYGHAHSDLTLQDFRSRDNWWDYTRYAMEFFNDNQIPFWEMENNNAISTASNDYGFYKPGEVYVAYLKFGGTTNIDLTGGAGQFEVKWYDPRNGGDLQDGTVTVVSGGASRNIGQAPNSATQDWVVLVRKPLVVDQGPFGSDAREISDGAVIQFEDYDVGGEGKAYHDATVVSFGDHSRAGAVDGGPSPGAVGERIGWTDDGEWLEYTVDTTAGSYFASVRYAAGAAGASGSLRLLLGDGPDGENFTELATFDLEDTGGFTTWDYATVSGISLDDGVGRVLRAEIVGGDFDLDLIEFSTEAPVNDPPVVTIDDVTQVVEQSSPEGVYEEQGGLVVMEMENTASPLGLWNEQTQYPGFTGDGYLQFTGNGTASGPPNSPLEFRFKINQSGLYYLHLRAARDTTNGQPSDHSNDAYVRVEGDYNAGPNAGNSHGNDAPLSMLKSNTKFFGGNANSFAWASGNRLDPGGHDNKRVAIYDFKAGEEYLLVVSGRSKFFSVDRIVFRHASVGTGVAQSLATPESNLSGPDNGGVVGYQIDATVTDDARLVHPPALQWSKVSGPGEVTFDDPNAEDVLATFSVDGQYELRLTADDGDHVVSETVIVNAAMTPNEAPTVSAGGDLSIKLPTNSLSLGGAVTDDGLPGGAVTTTWTVTSTPPGGAVSFADASAVDTTATFNVAGDYELRLTADDGDKSAFDEMTVTVRSELEPFVFNPIDDAFIENSTTFNDQYLKVEDDTRTRTSYLRFNVSGLEGFDVLGATLRLNVDGDAGNGPVSVHPGSHSNWTETNLSIANRPAAGASLDSVSGTHSLGQWKEFDVTQAVAGDGLLTLVVQITGGNDVWFSSSEGALQPELVVDVAQVAGGAQVVDRRVFYNGSSFDGGDAALNADDDQAIATDKSALLPGDGAAGFENYVTSADGITGLIVDIRDLADPDSLALTDFAFRSGNDFNPFGWQNASPPTSMDVRPIEPGVHRVSFAFAPGAIKGQWLEVTVRDTDATGLDTPDVFYFGSAPGDVGNYADNTVVNVSDSLAVRRNLQASGAGVENRYDFDRDGDVDGDDMQIVGQNTTNAFTQLRLIVAPSDLPQLLTPPPPGDFNGDGIVNALDYVVLRDHLELSVPAPVNGGRDYAIWRVNYGSPRSPAATSTASASFEPQIDPALVTQGPETPALPFVDPLLDRPAVPTVAPPSTAVVGARHASSARDAALLLLAFGQKHSAWDDQSDEVESKSTAEGEVEEALGDLFSDRRDLSD